jgi:hypothetical protein
MFASFGPFGLGFWETMGLGLIVVIWVMSWMAKKAVQSPTVQRAGASWFIGLFR